MYATGFVVVGRRWANYDKSAATKVGSKRRRGTGFTLHRDDCPYLKRATKTAMPAPREPYDGTVPCSVCKPQIKGEMSTNG